MLIICYYLEMQKFGLRFFRWDFIMYLPLFLRATWLSVRPQELRGRWTSGRLSEKTIQTYGSFVPSTDGSYDRKKRF